MTGADILEAAADLLETDGWCRYSRHDDNGHRCLTGAIAEATIAAGHEFVDLDAIRMVHAIITADLHPRFTLFAPIIALEWWNDQPGRTVGQVAAVLRDGARRLRLAEEPEVDMGKILQRAFGPQPEPPHRRRLTVVA